MIDRDKKVIYATAYHVGIQQLNSKFFSGEEMTSENMRDYYFMKIGIGLAVYELFDDEKKKEKIMRTVKNSVKMLESLI